MLRNSRVDGAAGGARFIDFLLYPYSIIAARLFRRLTADSAKVMSCRSMTHLCVGGTLLDRESQVATPVLFAVSHHRLSATEAVSFRRQTYLRDRGGGAEVRGAELVEPLTIASSGCASALFAFVREPNEGKRRRLSVVSAVYELIEHLLSLCLPPD